MTNDYEILEYTKNNEHKFKQHILDLKIKDMDLKEMELMGIDRDKVINNILTFDSENIFLIFVNKIGLVAIFGSKEIDKNNAYIWMITSKDIYNLDYKFAKYSEGLVNLFKKEYQTLLTYKYIDDKKGYKWLKYNGFQEDGKLYFNDKMKLMINKG